MPFTRSARSSSGNVRGQLAVDVGSAQHAVYLLAAELGGPLMRLAPEAPVVACAVSAIARRVRRQ